MQPPIIPSSSIHILIGFTFIQMAIFEEYCYEVKMLSCRTTDTKNYGLNITLHENSTLSSLSTVRKDVEIPLWRVRLLERGRHDGYEKIYYNGVIKSCEILNYLRRGRFFPKLSSTFFNDPEKGNLSLKCPLLKGNYVMKNIFVPPTQGLIKYMYSPNSVYTLQGGVSQLLPNNKMEKLCSYEINATISRLC